MKFVGYEGTPEDMIFLKDLFTENDLNQKNKANYVMQFYVRAIDSEVDVICVNYPLASDSTFQNISTRVMQVLRFCETVVHIKVNNCFLLILSCYQGKQIKFILPPPPTSHYFFFGLKEDTVPFFFPHSLHILPDFQVF